MSSFPFPDLGSFVRFLEAKGDLRRITAEVDPYLEATEIAIRAVKRRSPALLFENCKGSSVPLLLNPFATERRLAWAFGRPPAEIGEELKAFAEDMQPPRPAALWQHRGLFKRALAMRPRFTGRAPLTELIESPDLDKFPILHCWPEDGGRFLTYPVVMTLGPEDGRRNFGVYRMHVFGKDSTGMHWQIERGGGFHYAAAEKRGEALKVAVVLGTDPISMMAGILPLPENFDELSFAGFLRGAPVPTIKLDGLDVPANAEIVLMGHVPPVERHMEGPFGDHFGHYSHAAPYPVFHIDKVYRRRNAIYPAAVVGKPPQEDKYMGNAVQEMFLPLLKMMHPELSDLWTYYEAGFHNLAVASVRQRYKKEGIKTAFGLLGQGQMSLTKSLILVDPEVNVKDFGAVLEALRRNFDPREDFFLIPRTSQDTLDFTSFTMNLGSKMILDATSKGVHVPPAADARAAVPPDLGPGVKAARNWGGSLFIAQVAGEGRPVVERLLQDPRLTGYKLIAAVSEDVPLDDEELLIWGIFTRFDCARDIIPAKVSLRGAWTHCEGPLGIDATWKKGYPTPLTMSPEIVERVDRRWKDYGID